jgi:hypothetical protein
VSRPRGEARGLASKGIIFYYYFLKAKVDMMGVVLSSWERERVLSGTHAASGRHVSTWVHAVYSGENHLVGGSSSPFS